MTTRVPYSMTDAPVNVRAYGAKGDGITDDTAAMQAALSAGGRVVFPRGTYLFSQLSLPAGRGVILEGEGSGVQTILKHSGSSRAVVLSADDTQNVVFRNLTFYPSASTTSYFGFDDTTYDAYGLQWENCEFNQSTSGNTSVVWLNIVGSVTKQKHYFKGYGVKFYGGRTAISIGSGAATSYANDHRFFAVQIQGCARDGVLLNSASGNTVIGSIENCGDNTTYSCLRITGTSADNDFMGRLENVGAMSAYLPLRNDATGTNNRVKANLSATPTVASDLCNGEVVSNGIEFSSLQRRTKGLTRLLGATTADPMLFAQLATDTMGGSYAKFGLHADGLMGWATGTNPSAWGVRMYYDSANVALRVADAPLRVTQLHLTDGMAAPTATSGIAKIFIDSADGDLKIIFGDGVVKTIVLDT